MNIYFLMFLLYCQIILPRLGIVVHLCIWVAKSVACLLACYDTSAGSNPDISQK